MVRSPGFGSTNCDNIALFRLAFTLAPVHSHLNLPQPISRRLILQQARGQTFNRPPIACKLMVSCSISLPSRGSFHLSLAVLFTIGHTGVFSLTGGPRRFTRNFTCSVLLGIQLGCFDFRLQDFHFLWCSFQLLRLISISPRCCPTTPRSETSWFGLFPFRSPLLRESLLFSFPPATKMFQFAGLALSCLYIQQEVLRVAPFGNLRLKACFQLPEAFRR